MNVQTVRLSAFLALALACWTAGAAPKVSIFISDIKRVAKQRGVSIEESARLLKEAGIGGFDCNCREPLLPRVAKTVLEPVNFYGGVDFCADDAGVPAGEALVATALQYKAPRIMIIPDGFVEGARAESCYAKIRDGLRRLALKARAVGLVPMIEDYGGTNNICSHAGYVKRLLTDVPEVGYALDSGNCYYAGRGEDILDLMRFAKDRIAHVHLKDQTWEDNHVYATLGEGAVPNEPLVKFVAARGYDGWFTLENPVDPDRLEDVRRQVSVLARWYADGRSRLVCTAAEAAEGFVPLFNGCDLTGWTLKGTPGCYRVGRNGELEFDPLVGKGCLLTDRDYADFTIRFEFRMSTDCNNGLVVRTPPESEHPTFDGMEIQMLDDEGWMYTDLFPAVKIPQKDWGWHGSVYGVIPAKRRPNGRSYLKPAGEWNEQEVTLVGTKIRVTLNGTTIVDDDLSRHPADGTTPDGQKHPGLRNATGRLGWLSHGYPCSWRRIRLREIRENNSTRYETVPLNVSLFFAFDVQKVMRQRGVTLEEAARLLKEAGVSGFDCDYRDPKIPIYSKTLLKPANLYGGVDFCAPDGGVKAEDAFIAAAVSNDVPRIMVIPDGFVEGPEAESCYVKIRDGLRRLVKKARAVGVVPTIEDYGGTNNICSHALYIRRLLKDVPDLDYALDSGNLYYAGRGEDILGLMRYAEGRIAHVHLKDQTHTNNHAYATLGTGAVPNEAIVKHVAARGYDGWFTLENPVGPDLVDDVRRQVSVLRKWYEAGRSEGVADEPRPIAPRRTLDVSFARGKWNPDDFIVVKGPRWPYVHAFEQRDDAIVNPCPDISGEEIQKKHNSEVYAAMVHRDRFAFGSTVSSTMLYDYRMAPIIVLAPALGRTADGVPEFREHWEICLYDEGINVWHHFHDGVKASWRRAAAIRLKGNLRFPANVRHELVVSTRLEGGLKRLIVTCGDAELSYFDESLPGSFFVGVLGCEGRNFFYDLKVR